MAHPFAESLYAAIFEVETEDALEQSLSDWADFPPSERSFASAQLSWLVIERLDGLTDAAQGLQTLIEELATRPEAPSPTPPDIVDVEVLDE